MSGPSLPDVATRVDQNLPRTVVLTGHFPPEPGGVQTFVWEIVRRLPPERILIIAPDYPGARDFDRALPFSVMRRRGYWLTRGLGRVVAAHGATAAWIPAAAPFGLFAPRLRAAGVSRVVASSHGQELGWLRVPPTRAAFRQIARSLDVLTYLGPYTRSQLVRVVERPEILVPLAGGADLPSSTPSPLQARLRLGWPDAPTVVSVARLVHRKGQDLLVAAWPEVQRYVPDARLVLVGVGPMRRCLERRAQDSALRGAVTVAGYLPADELALALAAADVFALACRDDRRGLQTEGLGLSVLEASAAGRPVVVGRSGGSVDSVRDGVSGLLVRAEDPHEVAEALVTLLRDPVRAAAMGEGGRRWVRARWSWDRTAERLAALLRGEPDPVVSPAHRRRRAVPR